MSNLNLAPEPLKGIRRTIARRMTEAWAVPVFHASLTVEIEAAERRRQLVAGASLNDELLHAVAVTLPGHRALNALFLEDGVAEQDHVNLGVAVAAPGGLIVPVIHAADRLDLAELSDQRKRLVECARLGTLTHEDVAGGTFTVSNLGMFGIDRFDAILNVPQVAILAVGAAKKHVRLLNGAAGEVSIVELTATVDHRAADGVAAARFLSDLKDCLERS